MWADSECHKNPLFEGVGLELVCGGVVCRSLIKSSAGVEVSLWRLSCSFTETAGGLDLAMDDKGTPHAVCGSSLAW